MSQSDKPFTRIFSGKEIKLATRRLVWWFREKNVTDWKKAPTLAHTHTLVTATVTQRHSNAKTQ